jgi:hypothetical protein
VCGAILTAGAFLNGGLIRFRTAAFALPQNRKSADF